MKVLQDEDLILGCPKCQANIAIADKVKIGEIESGLEQCEDGLICRVCGLVVYKHKPVGKHQQINKD